MSAHRILRTSAGLWPVSSADLFGFVGREVVGDDVNLLAARLVGHDISEEVTELTNGQGDAFTQLDVKAHGSKPILV